MKIALIGYGKMGQEIADIIEEKKSHEIVSISYKKQSDSLDIEGIKKADVAIDFTAPEIILTNIEKIASLGINLVVGTTGWYDKLPQVKEVVNSHKVGLIYGGNFSIGVNIFFQICEYASKLFNKYSSMYDVYGQEIHHKAKKDSPSGTAKTLGQIIMRNFDSKKKLQDQTINRAIAPDELHFASLRGGVNPGRHEVIFDSFADEVQITIQAHGRQGYAQGAIIAAEFIKGKRGIFRFDELFKEGKI